jgi:DUF1680 family protein
MFRLDGDAKYIDVFERVLHNNFAAGVSIGGDAFFYVNPLASRGNVTRWRWHGCPCCPANVVRIIPQLGTYAYATANPSATTSQRYNHFAFVFFVVLAITFDNGYVYWRTVFC